MGIPPIASAKPVEAVVGTEKTTDRNYYYQKRAGEHQRQISQELATRRQLSEVRSKVAQANTAKRIVPGPDAVVVRWTQVHDLVLEATLG